MAEALLNRLRAHGLCITFTGQLCGRLPEAYQFNGLEQVERAFVNKSHSMEIDEANGKLKLSASVVNCLALDSDAWPSLPSDYPSAVITPANTDRLSGRLKSILRWLQQPTVVKAVSHTRRDHLTLVTDTLGPHLSEEKLRALRRYSLNVSSVIRNQVMKIRNPKKWSRRLAQQRKYGKSRRARYAEQGLNSHGIPIHSSALDA